MLSMNLQAHPTSSQEPKTSKEMPVLIYIRQSLIWGKVVAKPAIRVSIWLNTDMVPLYLSVVDAKIILLGGSVTPKSLTAPSLSVHAQQINAYHLLPPADEAPYFDPEEPNRKMEPVSILMGNMRFDGNIRMSAQTDLDSFLNVSKSDFLELFDVNASFPLTPSMGRIQTPFMLFRQSEAIIMHQA
jgi:hypothetical protein